MAIGEGAWADTFEAIKNSSIDDIKALGAELAEKHPYGPNDNDRVVLTVRLDLRKDGESIWSRRYDMDICGDQNESAMALCVSNGVACAVLDLLDGYPRIGINKAVEDIDGVKRWLSKLADWNIKFDVA